MYLLKLSLDYVAAKGLAERFNTEAGSQEAYEQVRLLIPGLPTVEGVIAGERSYIHFDHVGTVEDLETFNKAFGNVVVKNVRGLFKGEREVNAQTINDLKPTVQLHVPGSASLMDMKNVRVLEDYCTDALQRWLNKGWRMVAVCPPYDSRRPTYIIGHNEASPEEGL